MLTSITKKIKHPLVFFSKKVQKKILSKTPEKRGIDKIKEQWFKKGDQYWSSCQTTNNGVLGGYGYLHNIDINFSRTFLREIFELYPKAKRNRVVDCGAGIGRVTKSLLIQFYEIVDLFDQCERFIQAAKDNLKNINNIGLIETSGLQNYNFKEKYDCIWVQWALCFLPDDDALNFLLKAKQSLDSEGFIIVKDNQYQKDMTIDRDDYCILRSSRRHIKLFQQSNLSIRKASVQPNWPQNLQEVRMYCLS